MSQEKNAQSVEDAVPAVSVVFVSSVAAVAHAVAVAVAVAVVVVVAVADVVAGVVVAVVADVVAVAAVVSFAIDSGQSILLSTVFHLPH